MSFFHMGLETSQMAAFALSPVVSESACEPFKTCFSVHYSPWVLAFKPHILGILKVGVSNLQV